MGNRLQGPLVLQARSQLWFYLISSLVHSSWSLGNLFLLFIMAKNLQILLLPDFLVLVVFKLYHLCHPRTCSLSAAVFVYHKRFHHSWVDMESDTPDGFRVPHCSHSHEWFWHNRGSRIKAYYLEAKDYLAKTNRRFTSIPVWRMEREKTVEYSTRTKHAPCSISSGMTWRWCTMMPSRTCSLSSFWSWSQQLRS